MGTNDIGLLATAKTNIWALKLAWKIDKKVLSRWFLVGMLLSILPAVSLQLNRGILSKLSLYLAGNGGSFSDIILGIAALGIVLTATTLSTRLNGEYLGLVMDDIYAEGMHEALLDKIHALELKTLLQREVKDDFSCCITYGNALQHFICAYCILLSKTVSIVSLLWVAFSASQTIFWISLGYLLVAIVFQLKTAGLYQIDWSKLRPYERKSEYFRTLCYQPGAAKELRVYGTEEELVAEWRSLFDTLSRQELRRVRGKEGNAFALSALFYLFMVVIILFAIRQVAVNQMDVAVFLMVYMLCQSFSGELMELARGLSDWSNSIYALDHERRFIEDLPEKEEPAASAAMQDTEDVFQLAHVTFGYDPEKPVLRDINLRIKKGETVALVGYNGSGKTTLTKLLLGFYPPQEGELFFFGNPYSAYQTGAINQHIGVFF